MRRTIFSRRGFDMGSGCICARGDGPIEHAGRGERAAVQQQHDQRQNSSS
jgi:hypothetical protein